MKERDPTKDYTKKCVATASTSELSLPYSLQCAPEVLIRSKFPQNWRRLKTILKLQAGGTKIFRKKLYSIAIIVYLKTKY